MGCTCATGAFKGLRLDGGRIWKCGRGREARDCYVGDGTSGVHGGPSEQSTCLNAPRSGKRVRGPGSAVHSDSRVLELMYGNGKKIGVHLFRYFISLLDLF